MSSPGGKERPSLAGITIMSTLSFLNRGIPIPNEQDFLHLADELENDPPPGLTPEGASLVVAILRGEEID